MTESDQNPDWRARRTWNSRLPLALSFGVLIGLGLLIGVWASQASISGAVIGSGRIEASKIMTAVQHPVGGVIEEILAQDGDHVEAGDVVVRLEDDKLRTDLAIVEGNLYEVLANIARLEAIIDGTEEMTMAPELIEAAAERPEVARLVDRQKRQLSAHYTAVTTAARLLDQQISQVEAQIAGLEAQLVAKREEMQFIQNEQLRMEDLSERGLLKHSEMYNLQKSRTTVSGEIGRLVAKVAEMQGKATEMELKRLTIVPNEHKLAVADLTRIRPDRTKYLEQRAALQGQLRRLEIRAPISGRIHQVSMQGIRSVVVAAKPLMMIVPDAQPRMVTVRIRDTDIDQVSVGQTGTLKFKAFDGRHMPVVLASVLSISADAIADAVTRKRYYEVTLEFAEEELTKLGGRALVPGMPVDAYLTTDSRTPLNYVLRPLKTYFDKAFRDT